MKRKKMLALNDTRFLISLEVAGVRNWDKYEMIVDKLPEDATEMDELLALELRGVEDWAGFEGAVELYEETTQN